MLRLLGCRQIVLWLLFGLCSIPLHAAEPPIPDELKPWQSWVLQGEEFRRCPFFATQQPSGAEDFVCAWPERLTLNVTAAGGDFRQRWQVYAESWIPLPGSEEHWPRAVRLDGRAAAVVARGGVPSVRLPAGSYTLSGALQWDTRPEQLAIPMQTGIVELTVDGRAIAQPERPDGAVWLGKRRSDAEPQQMTVQVYRLVRDEVPALLTTQIRLQVAGEGREETLGKILPQGFVPMAIDSLLPARIEPDGVLRVQVRPGSWTLRIEAHGNEVATRFTTNTSQQVPEEVWSYQDNNRLRITALEGAELIDPIQASVPEEWRGFPAYRMVQGTTLQVTERSRGLENQDANQLNLQRQLWLDFDHTGFTVVDTIQGTMRQSWRLDAAKPYRVMSARLGADNLLVTSGGKPELSGVELRQPQLLLRTAGRLDQASGSMPATGWQTRFANVSGELNLPPGHHLLSAFGEVDAPNSWTSLWSLLDFFIVLIVAVSAWRLRSVTFGVLALGALVLIHQEAPSTAWWLINALIAVALVRVAPEGRLKTVVTWYRNVGLAILVLLFLPFAVGQVRLGVYPQLEAEPSSRVGAWLNLDMERAPEDVMVEVPMEAPAPAFVAPSAPEAADGQSGSEQDYRQSNKANLAKPSRMSKYEPSVASKQQVAQRYAPGTVLQSGPGVPNWRYNRYAYSWSGPVDVDEDVRFVIAGPAWMFLWRIVGVALLGALLAGLVQMSFNLQWPRGRLWPSKTTAAALLLAGVVGQLVAVPRAEAASTPDPALLGELKTRLTQPPACAPNCVETLSAQVTVTVDKLDMVLEVAALASVAVPVPVAAGRWEPESILVDGQSAGALYRDRQQGYWVALPAGAHTLRMSGRLAAAESIQLNFPQKPRAISTSGTGWEFAGLNQGRLLTNVLELVRQRSVSSTDPLSAATQFAPFVRVRRYLTFDLDWQVTTVVERIAPQRGAFTLEVPLLKGESVLTPGFIPRDKDGGRVVVIGLAAQDGEVSWTSSLPRETAMDLTMVAASARTEFWSFTVSPVWNIVFAGVPQVLPERLEGDAPWTFDYFPRAAEVLKLEISRPEPVSGSTLALDSVNLSSTVGRRSTNATLSLKYRSTQGGRHTIELPEDAEVLSVTADSVPVQVRPQNGELPLSLLPGEHTVEVKWQADTGASWRIRSPAVDLRTSASNLKTNLEIGTERWVFFTAGKGVGPAILYWGELAVFIVVAVLLGRVRNVPLRTHDWLLLGLGLSTFSWGVLLLFTVWILAMRRRAAPQGGISNRRFNFLQVVLGLVSLAAIGALVSAIPNGLLGQPDMSVRTSTWEYDFSWFLDQVQGPVPEAAVFSVPLYVYKAAILLWALWLSFALLRWLPWAWNAFNEGGLWRSDPPKAPPVKA